MSGTIRIAIVLQVLYVISQFRLWSRLSSEGTCVMAASCRGWCLAVGDLGNYALVDYDWLQRCNPRLTINSLTSFSNHARCPQTPSYIYLLLQVKSSYPELSSNFCTLYRQLVHPYFCFLYTYIYIHIYLAHITEAYEFSVWKFGWGIQGT